MAILIADVGMADRRDMVEQPFLEAGLAFGRGERRRGHLVPPQPIDQRLGMLEQAVQRRAAAGADKIVGILAGGKGDEGKLTTGADMGQRP